MIKLNYKLLTFLTLFGIAMGFVESSVVIYLRKLIYPEGFEFPLKFLSPDIVAIEWFREAAVVVVLIIVAILAGKSFTERFASFIFIFGVWDIFYYIWLKAILNWPASLFTWDVLFLIPGVWVGPVIAPLILSITMIILAITIFYFQQKQEVKLVAREWTLLISGSIIVVLTFMWDYLKIIFNDASRYQELILQYIPTTFNWPLFIIGELILLYAIWSFYKRHK